MLTKSGRLASNWTDYLARSEREAYAAARELMQAIEHNARCRTQDSATRSPAIERRDKAADRCLEKAHALQNQRRWEKRRRAEQLRRMEAIG